MNRSSKNLTEAQTRLLAKGLKFCPSSLIEPDYRESVFRLKRTIRIRYHFSYDANILGKPPPFKKKSTWMPPPAPAHVESYLSSLLSKIKEIQSRPTVNNLSKAERLSLKELALDHSLVIKKADKGSCLVIEDRLDYIKDGETHLADANIYQEIPHDYTESIVVSINKIVRTAHGKGHLSHQMKDYLIKEPTEVRTQQLYFLKKYTKTQCQFVP